MLTLDQIIRNSLLKNRKSLHFYLEYLVHGVDCLRELGFDVLKNVNTKKLTVNSYKAVTLPCDYVDFTKIGTPIGQYVKPLLQYDEISRLNNYDTNGNIIPYINQGAPDAAQPAYYTYNNILWYFNTVNQYGENMGRMFGFGQGRETDTYKIIRERNEIQLDEHSNASYIILEYISDGSDCDAATKVEPYAQDTIEKYIAWMVKECSRTYSGGERQLAKREYKQAYYKLVSRLNPLTIEDVKRISRRAYYGANKE